MTEEKSYYTTARRKTESSSGIKIEKGKMYVEVPEEICKIFENQGWCKYYLSLAFDVDKEGNITLRHEF